MRSIWKMHCIHESKQDGNGVFPVVGLAQIHLNYILNNSCELAYRAKMSISWSNL